MKAVQSILVPYDFSPHAEEAFRVGHVLAKASGARLVVFHVARPPAVAIDDGRFLTDPAKEQPTDLMEELRKVQSPDPAVKVEHRVIVADKTGAGPILEMLDRQGCDLIVMGTHGRTGLAHLLFGSVAEEVVRKAKCPVLVVKAPPAG
jgi:universal stress protein A